MLDQFEANSGAISYSYRNNNWHYYKWPEDMFCLTQWEKWKKEHPNWEDNVEWKVCGT